MKVEKRPIRVAQMMTEMNYGGVEMVVMNYYRHIDHSKVQFDFFVLEGSEIPQRKEIEELGGRIYIVPHYKHLIQYEKTLIKLFKENNYKIVHSHMNALSVFSLRAAKKAGIPVRIAHNHSTAGKGEYKKNIVKYMLRPLAKIYPTNLAACSECAGRWLFGKKANFTVFNNGVEIDKFKYNEQIRNNMREKLNIEDKFVIGNVGRLCYQKNQKILLYVLKELNKMENKYALILLGDGEDKNKLEVLAKKLEIENDIIFMGNVTDTSSYYNIMDIFAFPSRYEGLGIACVEAQINGLKCLVSEFVPDNAYVGEVKRCQLDNITQWITEICNLDSKRVRFVEEYFNKKGFNIKIESQKLLYYYLKLLNNDRNNKND